MNDNDELAFKAALLDMLAAISEELASKAHLMASKDTLNRAADSGKGLARALRKTIERNGRGTVAVL